MSRAQPVRTCVGCRERAPKSDLVRVVAYVDGFARSVVPDPVARRAGRGAHLHPVLECLDLAERRRAFPRAFRLEGPLDSSAVRSWITTNRQSSPEGAGGPSEAEQ